MKLSRFAVFSLFTIILLLHVIAGIYFSHYSWWWVAAVLVLYVMVLVLGSIFIQYNFYLRSKNRLPMIRMDFAEGQFRIDTSSRVVALTFDDGPDEHTNTILDILEKEQVKAAFFLIGKNIAGRETVVQRMLQDGHQVGNHSFGHGFNFDWQSAARMQQELEWTNQAISTISGQPVSLFRPPYGVTNPNLARAIQRTGLRSIGWSLRSMDTVAKDAGKLTEKILKRARNGDIILLHDRCLVTTEALPGIIAGLKQKGFSFTQV